MNASDAPGTPPAPRRVLVVEDNPDGRSTLQLLLYMLGHAVEVARDGLGGVERALIWRPDIAIVDIGLPVLDGYEMARRVREALADEILLAALTGYGQAEDLERAGAAGFDVYLVKPVDPDELSRLVGGPA
jgi:CheY-like chemotaxis protein